MRSGVMQSLGQKLAKFGPHSGDAGLQALDDPTACKSVLGPLIPERWNLLGDYSDLGFPSPTLAATWTACVLIFSYSSYSQISH